MSEIAPFISDLAVILVAAGVFTLIFKWLKQPVVLGYIVAGLVAGPAIPWVPSVTDPENIKVWADIGVIFLLFAMGLEFSFRKLMHVGGTAIIATVTIVTGMMFSGYTVGHLLGFSHISCLFLGGMLSMSSTAIVFKAFDDMGLRNQKFAGVVLGVLVVEDLVAVVLMVLLSTLAVSKHFEGSEMVGSILKLGSFLLIWSVLGIYLLPTFLKKIRKILNPETLLIVSLALCLGMVMIATQAGFSAALGAFVMGSLLAETFEATSITKLVQPVKNLFAAVFFVSVGMMIEPQILVAQVVPIIVLTVLVVVGQVLFATTGVLLSGQPLKTAMQSGFSLTQVGEFAFIIASLGVSLQVTDDSLYAIVVAVSVVTTFLTPYMIRAAEPAYGIVERRIPESWRLFLDRYSSGSNTVRQKSTWHKLLRSMLLPVMLYFVVCVFSQMIFFSYVAPIIAARIPGFSGSLVNLVIIMTFISPFLWMIFMKKNYSPEFQKLWNDNKYNRGPLVSLLLFKTLLCVALLMPIVIHLFDVASGMGFAFSLLLLAMVVFSKRLKKRSLDMEQRFLDNFSGAEKNAGEKKVLESLPFQNLHLADFKISPNSPLAGQTLRELHLRQTYGVSVVSLARGEERINIPGGQVRLFPHDRITVVGTDVEIEAFRHRDEQDKSREAELAAIPHETIRIEQFSIDSDSPLVGLSILHSELRSRVTCLVLGIERDGQKLMNPSSDTVFRANDIVWIAGETGQILRLSSDRA